MTLTVNVKNALICAPLVAGLAQVAEGQLPPVPVPSENPITAPKRILGKALFWEEQLSSDNTMACGTCHIASAGGSDPRLGIDSRHPGLDGLLGNADDKLGSPGTVHSNARDDFVPDELFGFNAQVTERRANSHIGAAFSDTLFWDGRATSTFVDPETGAVSIPSGGALESQAVGPILSPVEMGHDGRTWDQVRSKLEAARPLALAWDLPPDLQALVARDPSYPELFADAFGDPAINAERIAFAIATYERTLIPDQTPFDAFVAGNNNALTQQQVQGLNAFNGPARCVQCHSGPLFSDGQFRNVGLRPIAEDSGRQGVTGNFQDRGRFKVPGLRNVELRGRWFHNGDPGINTLNQAVALYNNSGGPFANNRDPILDGLNIPPQVRTDIAAFLTALTDPRVENELPPFDRPRLNSERPTPNPLVEAGGTAGSGGFVPQPIAVVPPNLGNADFKLGIQDGLGGALAAVRWSFGTEPGRSLGGTGLFGISPQRLVRLRGNGPGEGFATMHLEMPSDPVLVGAESTMRWVIFDPAAPNGRSRTPVSRLTFF